LIALKNEVKENKEKVIEAAEKEKSNENKNLTNLKKVTRPSTTRQKVKAPTSLKFKTP
jgi:hypothetical protein